MPDTGHFRFRFRHAPPSVIIPGLLITERLILVLYNNTVQFKKLLTMFPFFSSSSILH